jgi:hypothetical protein
LEADFSWEITGELGFSLRPEVLPELTSRENISDDTGLRTIEENLAARIENLVLQRLKSYADSEDESRMESLILAGSVPELDREVQASFPEIENFYCTIRLVRYPDFALYHSVKTLYQEYLTQQNSILRQDVTREAEKRIATRTRMDELTLYGELLTKYPLLLQYLALEGDLNNAINR